MSAWLLPKGMFHCSVPWENPLSSSTAPGGGSTRRSCSLSHRAPALLENPPMMLCSSPFLPHNVLSHMLPMLLPCSPSLPPHLSRGLTMKRHPAHSHSLSIFPTQPVWDWLHRIYSLLGCLGPWLYSSLIPLVFLFSSFFLYLSLSVSCRG